MGRWGHVKGCRNLRLRVEVVKWTWDEQLSSCMDVGGGRLSAPVSGIGLLAHRGSVLIQDFRDGADEKFIFQDVDIDLADCDQCLYPLSATS